MCGLCGMLGDRSHWSESGRPGDEDSLRARRVERQIRIEHLNRILRAFGCNVTDWQGGPYLLATYTGKSELVPNLPTMWAAVERLTGRQVDPLEPTPPPIGVE
jgi:hypothetical protein